MSNEETEKEVEAKKPQQQQRSQTFIDDIKTQEQLEDELGAGVEKVPKLGPEPELKTITLDLSGELDVSNITKQIIDKLDLTEANSATARYDKYQAVAKKIWQIKKSAYDSFPFNLRVGKKDEKGKWIWERDKEGRPIMEEKRFYFSPVTRQDKEEQLEALQEKEAANFDLIVETEKINKIVRSDNQEEQAKYMEKKTWIDVSSRFSKVMYKYYSLVFKSYYGATDDDLSRMNFDDVINYSDIALYKEGVRSPQ